VQGMHVRTCTSEHVHVCVFVSTHARACMHAALTCEFKIASAFPHLVSGCDTTKYNAKIEGSA